MGRLTMALRICLAGAILCSLIGCAYIQELTNPKLESQNKKVDYLTTKLEYQNKKIAHLNAKVESKDGKISQLAAELESLQQLALALRKDIEGLKADSIRLAAANNKLQQHGLEMNMKINMLKTLDHRVEEKRKNYIGD